ncbi:Cys-Gln thioester bond-forming surface protein [Glycomyces buryatensis]|uniref:TQXA domain-containing protein n=1 Tax=Glycomyces buryatensis TaxID=2570927 RepID=A0A4S8QGI7_9ACTN|nr:Cys-Gln thioester bond-forming surface protein [Glycomyces buryatensis]THV42292.1 TQXA domain-containing protein [Glycomyces buryatensis]
MTRHLRLAPLLALMAFALALLAPAGAALAQDEAPVSGDIQIAEGLNLHGKLDGKRFDVWANVLSLKPHDGGEALGVYCIDIRTALDTDSPYAEGDWESAEVANLEQVRWVLFNGHPNVAAGDLLAESGAEVDGGWESADTARVAYVATQAAVWHFTDGFELDADEPVIDGTDAQNEAVAAVYKHLTADAERLPDPSELYVDLEGEEEAAYADGRFGPYTLRSTAGPVELSAEGGRLVDAEGNEVDTLEDGEQFHIELDDDSDGITITGHASYDLPVGRVFLATTDESLSGDALNPMTSGASQKLILAEAREADIPAEWAFALEMPENGQPTEAEAAPKLPSTGSSLTIAFAAGLAMLVGGMTVLAFARRGRTLEH